MDNPEIPKINLEENHEHKPSAVGLIKNLLLFIVLALIIAASFYLSFQVGKRIMGPVSKEPLKKIEIEIPEPPESLQVLIKEEAKEVKVVPATVKKVYKSYSSESHSYYKVQAGMFANKGNARSLAQKLQEAGLATFIKKTSKGYRVQVGAYASKALANKQMNAVKNKGFSAIVIYE